VFSSDQYQLLDFGDGRKLERFGSQIVDRPAPAAEETARSNAPLWRTATLRFEKHPGGRGDWKPRRPKTEKWQIRRDALHMDLQTNETGQVGVFPEHAGAWNWLTAQIAGKTATDGQPLRVLNLFAYTGGATLVAALAGAKVTHVDSAKSVVARARNNAARCAEPVDARWIVDDVRKFVRREIKRGNQYHGVIIDPPTYGHGVKGEVWKVSQDLMPLLELCGEVTAEDRRFVLLTCHSPGFGAAELQACLSDAIFGSCACGAAARPLSLTAEDGRKLRCGFATQWPAPR